MKKIILATCLMLSASPVFAAQQTILGGSGVLWGDEKAKINSNFSELYGKLAQALLTTSSPTFVDLTLTSDLNLKDWIYFTSDDDTHYVALAAGNNTANYILRWPTTAPGGSNYLLNFDADGTGAWTDPSTLGGDNLGSATSSTVIALFGSGACSGYLKSDGTCDTPSGAAHDAVTLDTETAAIFSLSTQQLTLDSQTANYFLAAPNGSAGDPVFRAIVAADIPTLNQNTTGTAGGLSGTPNITVGTVTAAEYLTSAVDGNRWAGPINTTAISATATLGRMAWLTDRYWIANGTNWTTRYFLDSSMLGSNVGTFLGTPSMANFFSALTGEGAFADDLLGYADAAAVRAGLDLESGTDFNVAATSSAAGISELAIASEVNTGTDSGRTITPDALAGSNLGSKELGWAIVDSDVATAVADGKQAIVVPSSLNGMNLVDVTCAVSDLNSAASGSTTVVLRRVRGATAVDMTSTGVTIAYNEYTASDETVDTSNDDVQTGDKIFPDINAITTAAHKGLYCTAVFQLP